MTIKKRGSKWVLVSKTGKVLGTHLTKERAIAQEVAIELSKKRQGK